MNNDNSVSLIKALADQCICHPVSRSISEIEAAGGMLAELMRQHYALLQAADRLHKMLLTTPNTKDALCEAETSLRTAMASAKENLATAVKELLPVAKESLTTESTGLEETQAVFDVLAERRRQQTVEGWTSEHDDQHKNGSMALAAACYAVSGSSLNDRTSAELVGQLWPWTGWAWKWWKPKNGRRDLVRAAALILAEIERIDRAEAKKGGVA